MQWCGLRDKGKRNVYFLVNNYAKIPSYLFTNLNTAFILDGPALPEPPYFTAAERWLCSDYGTVAVSDEVTCKDAAIFLNKNYGGLTNKAKYPKGCHVDLGAIPLYRVRFNEHPTGSRSPSVKQVCHSKGK